MQTKITLEDIDKAADYYEEVIDSCVLKPDMNSARTLVDAAKALEILHSIREDIRLGHVHVVGDGK